MKPVKICSGCGEELDNCKMHPLHEYLCEDCAKLQFLIEKVRFAFTKWNTSNIKYFTHNGATVTRCPICGGICSVAPTLKQNGIEQVFCAFCKGYYYRVSPNDSWKVFLDKKRINYKQDIWDWFPQDAKTMSNKLDDTIKKLKELNL